MSTMIGAIVQARMNSTRLPGKVLLNINGRPMLSYLIERVASARCVDQIVVATSTESHDDMISAFCERERILCYQGSLDDVLDRYYQAARELGCDVVVRLTADCPLIDPIVIDTVVGVFKSGQFDFVANTVPPVGTYPDGMDVEVFSFEALERAWKEASKPSDREHVTFYFWKNPELFSTTRHDLDVDLGEYRLTVDYPEDLEVIRSLFRDLYPQDPLFTMKEIIAYLRAHPEIMARNAHIAPNQGWQSAFEKDKSAGFVKAVNG
jgi:spore coat polysaccharide biosynthesis protein SpsF